MGLSTQQKTGKRSPLRGALLPQAGGGLRHAIYDQGLDMIAWAIASLVFLIFAAMEWLRYWQKSPPRPWLATIMFLGVASYAALRIVRKLPVLKNLILGFHGERTVGQLLDSLRAKGYHVFHDLVDERGNIDHVLIGPGGVFAIETKTFSKPNDHDAKIVYNGCRILIDGIEPDRDALTQARAAAQSVRRILREQTGQDVPVKPVVLYPGWFVEKLVPDAEVYVANDEWFRKSFDYEHAARVLDEPTLRLLIAGIERAQQDQN